MSTTDSDALAGLCHFAQLASGADLVMAVEIEANGWAGWAASFPAMPFSGFSLARSGILEHGWPALREGMETLTGELGAWRVPATLVLNAALGVVAGAILVAGYVAARRLRGKPALPAA